jgi:hypothetical protein
MGDDTRVIDKFPVMTWFMTWLDFNHHLHKALVATRFMPPSHRLGKTATSALERSTSPSASWVVLPYGRRYQNYHFFSIMVRFTSLSFS